MSTSPEATFANTPLPLEQTQAWPQRPTAENPGQPARGRWTGKQKLNIRRIKFNF